MEKKNNGGLIAIIIILVIALLGLSFYVVYDKGLIFNNEQEINENEESNSTDNQDDVVVEIKELDLTKSLNTSEVTYKNATDVEGDYGLSMVVNSDGKSVTLSIDWEKFGPFSGASVWGPDVDEYQITGFTKDVVSVFVGDIGQDFMGITLFYLMSDGTVEYTPMFERTTDSKGNIYYVMSYVPEYSGDKIIGQHFVTNGSLNGVNSVIKFYVVDASAGSGWRTTIGATADGSFYDLGHIINN